MGPNSFLGDELPSGAAKLFDSMAPSLGGQASSAAFGGGIVIYFGILGFLTGWLNTRLYLVRAMRDADTVKLLVEATVAASKGDAEGAKQLHDRAEEQAIRSSTR